MTSKMDKHGETTQADLNELIEGISCWQKQVYCTYRENIQSQQGVSRLNKEISELKEADQLKDAEIQECNSRISTLQEVLSKGITIEDENRQLRKELVTLKDTVKDMEKAHQCELTRTKDQVEELREVLKVEIEDAKEEVKQTAAADRALLQKTIAEKTAEAELLQHKLAQSEKQKQADIMTIRFEYDTKILKQQRENARKHIVPQTVNINQDIFRKKLQHAKAEAEREITALRKQIQELQQQKLPERTEHQQPKPAPGNMAKRIRRF